MNASMIFLEPCKQRYPPRIRTRLCSLIGRRYGVFYQRLKLLGDAVLWLPHMPLTSLLGLPVMLHKENSDLQYAFHLASSITLALRLFLAVDKTICHETIMLPHDR